MCKTGDLVGVRNLLDNDTTNQSLHAKDSHGNSLLYYACLCGRIALVKFLSDLGLCDDGFKRCYWNSLSIQTRSILKLYNDYNTTHSSSVVDSTSSQEIGVLSLMNQYVMKCIHNNSNDGQLTESKSGEDMILKFQFKDQEKPTEYKCQSWITLSRWPQIVLFIVMNTIEVSGSVDLSFIDPVEMSLCKMSAQDFENYVKKKYLGLEQKALYKKMKMEKTNLKELKAKYKIFNIPNLDACNEALKKNLETIKNKLSIIDFGFIQAKKEHFDMAMIFIYTGKVPNQNYDLLCMLDIAVMLKIKVLSDHLCDVLCKANQESQEEQIKSNLDPINYLFKSTDKISNIDLLKKNSCNIGITMANSKIPKTMLGHKNILMARCEFFHVTGTCKFEEGLKFQCQESNNEIPVVELHQFSTEETLQDLLRYIYCEKVNITKSNAIELMSISDLYGLSSLSNKCEQFLCENTSTKDGNLFEIYILSITMEKRKWQRSLESKTLDYVLQECNNGRMKQSNILKELEALDLSPDLIQRFKNASNSGK